MRSAPKTQKVSSSTAATGLQVNHFAPAVGARVVFVDFGFDLEGVCALERPATAAAAAKKALTAPSSSHGSQGPLEQYIRAPGMGNVL